MCQLDENRSCSSQMSQTVSRSLTWAEGLQEPGASRPAWRAGFRLSGVEGSDGLDIGLVVTCGWNLQHRDDCTLVQQAVRRHHFCVALLTATHSRLTQEGGKFNTMVWTWPIVKVLLLGEKQHLPSVLGCITAELTNLSPVSQR